MCSTSLKNSWKWTFRRNSECERPGIFITIMDEINIGQRSSDQMGASKSLCLRRFRLMCWSHGKGQVEDLRMYSSYQDAVGIDGEAIEFEWRISPGFPTLFIFQETQKDCEEKNLQPENFSYRIIFMSMLNDFLSKTDDENCISNAKKVKNYAKKFLPGHWTGPGSEKEMVWRLTINKDSGIAQPTKWYSNSETLGILSSQVPVTIVEPEDVKMLVSSQNLAFGKKMQACGSLKEQQN